MPSSVKVQFLCGRRKTNCVSHYKVQNSSATNIRVQAVCGVMRTVRKRPKITCWSARKNNAVDRMMLLAHMTAPSAETWQLWSSDHVLWILCALPQGSPSLTTSILISAAAVCAAHCFVKGIHMNPLCCRPLLAF